MNNLAFKRNNSGIAAVAIVVVVVIVIAVVGVAAYVALAKPSSNTSSTVTTTSSSAPPATTSTSSSSVPPPVTTATSSSSSSSVTTSSSTSTTTNSTTAAQSTTSTTTQTVATTTGSLGYFSNIKDLIGNFSQMSLQLSTSNSSGTTLNETLSYNVVGTPIINGSQVTEVNFTFISMGSESQQSGSNVSLIIFYNAIGNITLVQENGQNITGIQAAFAGFVVLPFNLFLGYQQGILKNFTSLANFQNQGTTTETYGHLTLPVTTYTASNFTYQNFTATSATFKVGHLPNSNLDILTLISVTGATGTGVSGTENFQYGLVSATQG